MRANGLRGIHVFWMAFAFFAVVIGVDTVFITGAVRTFPGEQVANSYMLGIDFNREVARREHQQKLGWTAQAGVENEGGKIFLVRMRSGETSPVTGLSMIATVFLAGKGALPRTLTLVERRPGEYAAPLTIASPGRLEVTITARRASSDEPVFEADKTLVIT